jgi:hypothetical protein
MREEEYREEIWRTLTKKTLKELDEEWRASLKKGALSSRSANVFMTVDSEFKTTAVTTSRAKSSREFFAQEDATEGVLIDAFGNVMRVAGIAVTDPNTQKWVYSSRNGRFGPAIAEMTADRFGYMAIRRIGRWDEWHVDIENSVTLAKVGSYLFFPVSTKTAYLRAIRPIDEWHVICQ